MDGRYLEAVHPIDSLAWVVVEAALVLYQSLEVHLLNRKLLVGLDFVGGAFLRTGVDPAV